jgi:hypothetical protein
MTRPSSLPTPLGETVRRLLASLDAPSVLGEIVAVWPGAVGEAIASNAWPARVGRDGTLHVATSSSTWAFELGHCAETILGRLRERLGEKTPSNLRFAVGQLPEAGPEQASGPVSAPPGPTHAQRATAARIAAEIDDSELRELVAKAVAAGLALPAEGQPGRRF